MIVENTAAASFMMWNESISCRDCVLRSTFPPMTKKRPTLGHFTSTTTVWETLRELKESLTGLTLLKDEVHVKKGTKTSQDRFGASFVLLRASKNNKEDQEFLAFLQKMPSALVDFRNRNLKRKLKVVRGINLS